MKAATLVSIFALACAGTACSEKAPAETETANAEAEAASTSSGQFNLRYPGSDTQPTSTSTSGEFNLRVPETSAQPEGIRLPEGAVRENTLSGVGEIQAPSLTDETPPEDPEDDIIRLD